MIEIKIFTHAQISDASALVLVCYNEERHHVPALPPMDCIPDLTQFADNGLGVAAFENEKMLGFLCFYSPWDNAFGTTYAKGTFSPAHGHGVAHDLTAENRNKIYRQLYQAAAEKWVNNGIVSHCIALYAHDAAALKAFYTYGFGLRCMDAIRPMVKIDCLPCEGYEYRELPPDGLRFLLELKNGLIAHLGNSPTFLRYPPATEEQLEATHKRRNSRYFCTFYRSRPAAFLEFMDRGENFACDAPDMKNICGAYCLPEHRSRGVYQNLINHAISVLRAEGSARLGVDFESFNPTAYGFWLKYFTAYTHSVVRRIDERILEANE